jgi:hypothetical protein
MRIFKPAGVGQVERNANVHALGLAHRAYNTRMDVPEIELLKQDVLSGGNGEDCFIVTLADEEESQAAEDHILQWLADRGLTHSVRRNGDSVYVSLLPLTEDDWQEVIASDGGEASET